MSKEEQKGLHTFYNNAVAMREKQKCMEYWNFLMYFYSLLISNVFKSPQLQR